MHEVRKLVFIMCLLTPTPMILYIIPKYIPMHESYLELNFVLLTLFRIKILTQSQILSFWIRF
jgi:hypothetical protein